MFGLRWWRWKPPPAYRRCKRTPTYTSTAPGLARPDLYRAGADVNLLRMARSVVRVDPDNIRPEDLLDRYVEGWRTTYANDERFAVEWDAEGMPSVVYRGDD